jgi:hypothetical protein
VPPRKAVVGCTGMRLTARVGQMARHMPAADHTAAGEAGWDSPDDEGVVSVPETAVAVVVRKAELAMLVPRTAAGAGRDTEVDPGGDTAAQEGAARTAAGSVRRGGLGLEAVDDLDNHLTGVGRTAVDRGSSYCVQSTSCVERWD